MKKHCIAFAAALGAILVIPAHAARDAGTKERKEACFKLHGKLMDKPAIRTVDACWRVHGYLMKRT